MSACRASLALLAAAALAATGCRAIAGIEDLEVTTCSDDPKAGLPACACDGKPCDPEPVLTSEAKHTFALRITEGKLVFAGGTTILSCNLDTCETSVTEVYTEPHGSGRFVVAMEALGKDVFFADMVDHQHGSGIVRVVKLSGVAPTKLVLGIESPFGLAATPELVYFGDQGTGMNDGAVGSCPWPKCITPKVAKNGLIFPAQVFVEGDDMYFLTSEFPFGKQVGALYRCSPGTTCKSITRLYAGDALGGYPIGIVLAKEGFIVPAIYFDKRPSKLFLITREGVPTELVTEAGLDSVAATDDAVYWTNPSKGTVEKIALSDGAKQVTLASDQGTPRAIAVDDTHVYWVTELDGTIWRVAR